MLYPDINSQKKTQQNSTRYRTALYLRLSREDGDKTESDSIANQRTLLEAYAADHPELCIVDEFVDDGYSGSNFERPAFQRLFQELEQGTINCILVKDLSRFGRNYIEVGRYLERIFPVMRVRLIAVTDNYDSQSAWKTSDSIMVPMRNLLNDAYCRDISVKIKSQLAVKRKRGDFVGSFATYGYRKDPTNHSKLIVDELAAETVQDIFRWKISGMNNQSIADRLNAKKVPSPAARKLQSGAKLSLHFRKSEKVPSDYDAYLQETGMPENAVVCQGSGPHSAQRGLYRKTGAGEDKETGLSLQKENERADAGLGNRGQHP